MSSEVACLDFSDRQEFTEYLKEQNFEPKVVRWRVSQAAKSLQTEKTYLYWIHRFRRHFSQVCPEEYTSEHVKDFLTWLANERNVAVAAQNQALNALLYGSGIRLNARK